MSAQAVLTQLKFGNYFKKTAGIMYCVLFLGYFSSWVTAWKIRRNSRPRVPFRWQKQDRYISDEENEHLFISLLKPPEPARFAAPNDLIQRMYCFTHGVTSKPYSHLLKTDHVPLCILTKTSLICGNVLTSLPFIVHPLGGEILIMKSILTVWN